MLYSYFFTKLQVTGYLTKGFGSKMIITVNVAGLQIEIINEAKHWNYSQPPRKVEGGNR